MTADWHKKDDNLSRPFSVSSSSASLCQGASAARLSSAGSEMSASALLQRINSKQSNSSKPKTTSTVNYNSSRKAKAKTTVRAPNTQIDTSAIVKSGPPSTAVQMMRRAGALASSVRLRDYTIDDRAKQVRAMRLAAISRQLRDDKQKPSLAPVAAFPVPQAVALNAIEEEEPTMAVRTRSATHTLGAISGSKTASGFVRCNSLSKSRTKSQFLRSFSWSDNCNSLSGSMSLRHSVDKVRHSPLASNLAGLALADSSESFLNSDNDDYDSEFGDSGTKSSFNLQASKSQGASDTESEWNSASEGESVTAKKTQKSVAELARRRKANSEQALKRALSLANSATTDIAGANAPHFAGSGILSGDEPKPAVLVDALQPRAHTLNKKKSNLGNLSSRHEIEHRPLGSSRALPSASNTHRTSADKRRPKFTNIGRILPFLSPVALNYKSSQYKLRVGKSMFRHRSKLRVIDLHTKFLNGNINVTQKDTGELVINGGANLQLIKQYLGGHLASVLKPKYFQRLDTSRIAILRSTNSAAYLRYVKGVRHAHAMTAKKDELEKQRTLFLAKFSEFYRLRGFVENLEKELGQTKSQYEKARKGKMGYQSQLMESIEAHNEDVENVYRDKMKYINQAERAYLDTVNRCNSEIETVASRQKALVTRYNTLGNEIKSLKAFKTAFEKNSLIAQKSMEALAIKREDLRKQQKEHIDKLYARHELERQAIETQLVQKVEKLLNNQISGSADIVYNVLSKLKNLNSQLLLKCNDSKNRQATNALLIAQLESEKKTAKTFLKEQVDIRRDVLNLNKKFSYS